jgi:O-antigen ligase
MVGTSMRIKEKNYFIKALMFSVVAITLAMTPGLNKDSLIVPKLIILFCLALFLLPITLKNISVILTDRHHRILAILVLILLIDGTLILVSSTSPIEQLIFGRMGRGLGFITFFSFIVILMASSIIVKIDNIDFLLKGIVLAGLLNALYVLLQYFKLDVFKWDSKTNGIIGTLGNPNSLSSFIAMILIPAVVIFWYSKRRILLAVIFLPIFLFSIYASKSTQGYIGFIVVVLAFSLIFIWYKNKIVFYLLSLASVIMGVIAIFGMLGHGPLSYYLYKVSVQSRGDFWRSAIATGNSHPLFGVGFDSFGDYSLRYRDEIAASHSFVEYTDSAHNFYLDYLATGGYPYLFLNILLTILVLRSFLIIQRSNKTFDSKIAALFCAWLMIQLQAVINTQSITFISVNALISGAIIGIAGTLSQGSQFKPDSVVKSTNFTKVNFSSILLVIIGLIISFPYFNSDRLTVKASNTGNGDLLIKATTSYPQSVTKYSQASRALLESGLPVPSLYLAQKGVEFNPNSSSLWALILINKNASIADRQNAKSRILELDPFNNEVKNFLIN